MVEDETKKEFRKGSQQTNQPRQQAAWACDFSSSVEGTSTSPHDRAADSHCDIARERKSWEHTTDVTDEQTHARNENHYSQNLHDNPRK
jgi:hypothetical protein